MRLLGYLTTDPCNAAAAEAPVEVEGGADQRQVGEGLREVTQGLAARPGLLGVQPDVVAVAQHLLEPQAGLGQAGRVDPSGPGQGLDQPEAAYVERPLHARQPVRGGLRVLAVDQPVGGQPATGGRRPDRVHGGHHARVVGGHVAKNASRCFPKAVVLSAPSDMSRGLSQPSLPRGVAGAFRGFCCSKDERT